MIGPELKIKVKYVVKKVIKKLITFAYPEKGLPPPDKMTMFISKKCNTIISLNVGEDYYAYEDYLEKQILKEYEKALKTKDGKYFLEFFKEEANRNFILDSEVGADISAILPKFKNEESIRWLKENIIRLDRVDLIKQMHIEGTIYLTIPEADMAIKYSSQNSLIYLINNGMVDPKENILISTAILCGNTEIQQILVDYEANIEVNGVSPEDTRLKHIKEYISKKDFNIFLTKKLEKKSLSKTIKI